MDLFSAKIETLFSSLKNMEGHLPSRYDLALDELLKNLIEVRDQAACSPEATLSIIQGLQAVQQIGREAENVEAQGDEGNWSYKMDGFPELSTSLTLKCDRPAEAELNFQLDPSDQVCGLFTLALADEPEETLIPYTFQQRPDGWHLCQPGEARLACRIELPEGYELPWKPSIQYDFLDELLSDGGVGILNWIKSFAASEPEKEYPIFPPAPAPKMCRNCGAPLEPNMRFCGQCAAPVQAEQSPAV
jgi:hypothetical protein